MAGIRQAWRPRLSFDVEYGEGSEPGRLISEDLPSLRAKHGQDIVLVAQLHRLCEDQSADKYKSREDENRTVCEDKMNQIVKQEGNRSMKGPGTRSRVSRQVSGPAMMR